MNLHIKYRPRTLNQFYGNSQTVSVLSGLLEDPENFPHSILFYGDTGCGKTTLGRIVANSLGCKGTDFREINSADFRGIDTIRDIIKQSQFLPLEGDIRVWLIDEAHKMTGDAQNALLKILEEPPSHVYFILCTTEPQKLLATVKGRCNQMKVSPLTKAELQDLLEKVVHKEKEEVSEEIYQQIIETSLCRPRDALQILEQVLTVAQEERLEVSKRSAEIQADIMELCRALLKGETWDSVKRIVTGLKEGEVDAEGIRRTVLGYMQSVLLKSRNDKAAFIVEQFWEPTYDVGFPYITYACYSIINLKR